MAEEKPRPDPRRAGPRPTRFFLGSAGESPATLAERLREMVAQVKADEADEEGAGGDIGAVGRHPEA